MKHKVQFLTVKVINHRDNLPRNGADALQFLKYLTVNSGWDISQIGYSSIRNMDFT